MYKCIIFDVDGTLINTRDAFNKSYYEFIEMEKLDKPSDEVISNFFGLSTKACFDILGILGDCIAETQKWAEIYQKYEDHIKLFDGIGQVLEDLKRESISLGIVTSRNHEELFGDHCFKPIEYLFDNIIVYDDTEFHKPHPEPLLKFLEKSNYLRSECIYIGDTIYDYQCAQEANINFALASWGTTILNDIEVIKLTRVEDMLSLVNKHMDRII